MMAGGPGVSGGSGASTQDPGSRHPHLLFHRQIETIMLGAITQVLIAAGFGFTLRPATSQRAARASHPFRIHSGDLLTRQHC